MATKPPNADIDEADVHVSGRKKVAVGVPAVLHALQISNDQMGVVRSVQADGVMAVVEIEAGPHRITAAITRDAVEEHGLAPGVPATAAVKATSVMVERG